MSESNDTPIELPFAGTRAAKVTISMRSAICAGYFRNHRRFAIVAQRQLEGVPKPALAEAYVPCSLISPDICPFLTDFIRPKPDICLENAYMWTTCFCQSGFWDILITMLSTER